MIGSIDRGLIHFFRSISVPVARIGLFTIFFWFGFLKVIGLSPATELVQQLHAQTIPFIMFGGFYVFFAAFECLIGILFLIKGMERVVIPLLFFHMALTFLPLFLLPDITWQTTFVPTLEGQYIIKNLALIALAIGIAAHLHPMNRA